MCNNVSEPTQFLQLTWTVVLKCLVLLLASALAWNSASVRLSFSCSLRSSKASSLMTFALFSSKLCTAFDSLTYDTSMRYNQPCVQALPLLSTLNRAKLRYSIQFNAYKRAWAGLITHVQLRFSLSFVYMKTHQGETLCQCFIEAPGLEACPPPLPTGKKIFSRPLRLYFRPILTKNQC